MKEELLRFVLGLPAVLLIMGFFILLNQWPIIVIKIILVILVIMILCVMSYVIGIWIYDGGYYAKFKKKFKL